MGTLYPAYDGTLLVGAENLAATDITNYQAKAHGVIDASNSVFDVVLYWGTNDGQTTEAAWQYGPSYVGTYTNLNNVSVSGWIDGLVKLTNHYVTVVITNAATNLWATPSTNFITTDGPKYLLTIASDHATPDPEVGVHTNYYGTIVDCTVPPTESVGGTQYVCTGWTLTDHVDTNGAASGVTTNTTLRITNSATLTWLWGGTKFYLDTGTNGSGGVSVDDGWIASAGSTDVVATAAANYHFTSWSGDTNGCTINGTTVTVSMTQARVITANFAIDQHNLTVNPGPGIAVPTGVTAYDYGTDVACTLTNSPVIVVADSKFECLGWTATGSLGSNPSGGTNTGPFTLTADTTVTWQWQTNYWLDLTAGANGTVEPADKWVAYNASEEIRAAPDGGYAFNYWTGDIGGVADPNAPTTTVTVTSQTSITASFGVGGAGSGTLFMVR